MKRTLLALLAVTLCSVPAAAGECEKTWKPPVVDRPDITCASFTEKLIFGLAGATKAEVRKAMGGAQGREVSDSGHPTLHYLSVADRLSGGANFRIGPDDRVVLIFGVVDNSNGRPLEFAWSPDPHPGPRQTGLQQGVISTGDLW